MDCPEIIPMLLLPFILLPSSPENDYDSDGCLDSTNDNDDDNDGFSDEIELTYGSSPVNELDTPSIDLENILSALNTSINIADINTKLTLWLDAKNTDFYSNSTMSNQGNMETWLDLSGKGNHAYAENNESTPLFTESGIYFDGNNDGLKLNSNILSDTAYTIITVEKRSSLNRVNKIIGQVRTSNSHLDSFNKALHYGYRNETELAIAQYANDFYVPISESSDPTSINTAISNANSNNQFKIYSNGQLMGSGNGNNPGHLKGSEILIGRSYDQYYHGHILEVLIFNDELNSDQITLINAYLSQKWNLLNKNDSDNDGTVDSNDAFWLDPTESLDTDTDGIGNNQDTDDDNDGYSDIDETLHCNENSNPLNNNSIPTDYDGDFICNELDEDDDNDNINDNVDDFPLNSMEFLDTDGDGIGNTQDTDDDNDGYSDIDETLHCNENSDPLNNNSIPTDYDNDFICSALDSNEVMSGTGSSVETSNLLTYPNPMKRTEVNGSINYVLNQNAAINLHIYNMFGQKVHYSYYESGQNGGKINQNSIYLPPHILNLFPAGIYIILISNNGKTLGKSKLVIMP